MTDDRDWGHTADRLGRAAVADGAPTRWYEELWGAAARDEIDTPWDRPAPNPPVAEQVEVLGAGAGRRAVVVGAGLGADAELLAGHGWETTAFDISPSAVELARGRHPESRVTYRMDDLLDPSPAVRGIFDLVVEVFTLQALHPSLRSAAGDGLRALLAPGGTALVAQFVREQGAPYTEAPPWLLDEAEVRALAARDVHLERLERRPHPSSPSGPDLWVALLRRDGR